MDDLRLRDGDRVAIVGGGPAGTFFAHFLKKFAAQRGLTLSIAILDGKNFLQLGPRGCNMCAGVISETLVRKLEAEGISLPEGRVQRRIMGYCLQTGRRAVLLTPPEPARDTRIVTVFRGNGPRFSTEAGVVSFDDFLLRHVQQQGVQLISEVVEDIILPSKPSEPARVLFGKGGARQQLEAALVVGAFGLNLRFIEKMKRLGFGYRPPRTLRTGQAEVFYGKDEIERRLGNHIHVFLLELENVRFAAFVPKGEYVTVTLIGKRDVRKQDLSAFLAHPVVRRLLPDKAEQYCSCSPLVAVTPARRPYADRLAILGDASVSRYHKNGIESAFLTAQLAAQAAMESGISAKDFQKAYYAPARQLLARDNFYGRLLFGINDYITSRHFVAEAHLDLLSRKDATASATALRSILWNMFTGNQPYRKIFFTALQPALQLKLLRVTAAAHAREGFRRLRTAGKLPRTKRLAAHAGLGLGPLADGQTVVIVGGGPAGASCAIALKALARQRALDLHVVLYEGKNFKGEHYNQCVGVLSPPIKDILERGLGIPFPRHLVQREIRGYCLHSDDVAITLDGADDVSYAVRRITFDDYLLQKAAEAGVTIMPCRVTDLDLDERGVMVYSEADNRRADVLVAAFGLDEGSCRMLERVTAYRSPRFLSSIVTKFHPGQEIMDAYGSRIHAFLPSPGPIEFGAVTPKWNHLTINIAGADVTWEWMDRFLEMAQVAQVLPPNFAAQKGALSYHKGRFPTRPARGLCGDRYVAIGDAAGLVRPFKGKGVNAACLTGLQAAETMLRVGISGEAFQSYVERFKDVLADGPYGALIRRLAVASARYGFLTPILQLAQREEPLQRALFDCVSARKPFRHICAAAFDFRLLTKIILRVGAWSLGFRQEPPSRPHP